MSERPLLSIIEDLHSDVVLLGELFRIARSEDPKISRLVDRFEYKLRGIELDLEMQVRLCKYLPVIKVRRSAYRELYTRILFKLQQHRQSAYLLHMVYELLSLREKARKHEDSRKSLSLVDEYIDSLAEELNLPTNLLLVVAPQSEYASLPILSERAFIMMLPLTNLTKPWKWVLLSHELGHLYFQYHKESILVAILPVIEEELKETIRKEEQVEEYVHLWGEYWLQEIISDIVATALCGPAYLKILITEATEPKPTQLYGTHPPLDARAFAQITYVELVGADSELTLTMKRVWEEFRNGVRETASLPDYLSEEIVEHISRLMVNIIRRPFIVTNWGDFKRVMNGLPGTKDEDLRFVIPAMALSDVHVRL